MAFQSQVNLYTAEGVAGDLATPDQAVYTPQNFLVGSGGVEVGKFAFADATSNPATVAKKSGAGKPLGIVQRVINYANYELTEAGSMLLPQGAPLTIVVKGDVWMTAPSVASVGQKVFVNNSTGEVSLSSAGASVTSSTETDWIVKTPAVIGGMMIVSNW